MISLNFNWDFSLTTSNASLPRSIFRIRVLKRGLKKLTQQWNKWYQQTNSYIATEKRFKNPELWLFYKTNTRSYH